MMLEQRVGSRVYLRVEGPLEPAVAISGVTLGYSGSLNPVGRGSAEVSFDVTNTGNVRLSGAPVVTLKGLFGIRLGRFTLDPVANLMPGGTGHVTVDMPKVAPLFYLSAEVTVTPTPADGQIGEQGLGLASVSGSATTWAVPWSALAVLVVGGGGTWFVIWRRRRSREALAAELAEYTEQIKAGVR
jgi:hypothetical protein